MVDDSIIRKIKACLARSKSSNPNEAAIALRQAYALMKKHSIELSCIEDKINKADILTIQKKRLPDYSFILADLIATFFECDYYFSSSLRGGKIVFFGEDNAPTIAAYAFEVLHRQLTDARQAYIVFELGQVKVKANKTQRANAFARGWIDGVRNKLKEFSSLTIPEHKRKRLDEFAENQNIKTSTTKITTKGKQVSDRFKGFGEGLKATLFHATEYTQAQTEKLGKIENGYSLENFSV